MEELTVSFTGPDDARVATVSIDRPAARNALSQAVMAELERALDEVERSGVTVVVIRGGGDRAFISGGDLKDLAALRTHDEAIGMAGHMRTILDRLAVLPALTIAALNGHALGGGAEVAVACDLRVAAADVTMAFNQSQLSITPAWGGTERLTTLVGRSRALELLLTPRRLTSVEALHIGLVNEVVERDAFDARIDAIATSVARLPATVVLPLKQLVHRVAPALSPTTRDDAVDAFATTWVSDEHWSAVAAMTSARQPR